MKKLFCLLVFALLLAGCTTSYKLHTATEKIDEKNFIAGNKKPESVSSSVITYTYTYPDKRSKLASGRTISDGATANYKYDKHGRLTTYVLSVPGEKTVTYTYIYLIFEKKEDGREDLITVFVDGKINSTYKLDKQGRIANVEVMRPNKKKYTVCTFEYNKEGYLSEVQDYTVTDKRIFTYPPNPRRKHNPVGSLNNAILICDYVPEYQPQKQQRFTLNEIEEFEYTVIKEQNGYIVEEEVAGTLTVSGSHKTLSTYQYLFDYIK